MCAGGDSDSDSLKLVGGVVVQRESDESVSARDGVEHLRFVHKIRGSFQNLICDSHMQFGNSVASYRNLYSKYGVFGIGEKSGRGDLDPEKGVRYNVNKENSYGKPNFFNGIKLFHTGYREENLFLKTNLEHWRYSYDHLEVASLAPRLTGD